MRFEFDENGYVCCILEGCYSGSCTGYEGLVPNEPEEYLDMDDWADRAQTRAYKLNEQGNLIYDAERAAILQAEEEKGALGIVDLIYPVGSIYMTVNDTSPEILFGGMWERIEDKFILSAGASYEAGSEGGAESYDLSVSHKHTAPIGYNGNALGGININGTTSAGSGKAYRTVTSEYSGTLDANVTTYYTGNATVSASIPTIPPYLAVFVWKRTA